MAIVNVGMQSPWMDYYKKIDKFFEGDEGVDVIFDESTFTLTLFVEDKTKANALNQLIPPTKEFGNITVKIKILEGNKGVVYATHGEELANVFEDALAGNKNFVAVYKYISDFITNPILYVVFKCEVVQYYIDDLSDAYGNRNTLWETIASEIFETPYPVYYSTEAMNTNEVEIKVE